MCAGCLELPKPVLTGFAGDCVNPKLFEDSGEFAGEMRFMGSVWPSGEGKEYGRGMQEHRKAAVENEEVRAVVASSFLHTPLHRVPLEIQ